MNPSVLRTTVTLLTTLLVATSTHAVHALELRFVAASGESLAEPHDIVLSPDRSLLYVADNANHRIVVLDATSLDERGVFGKGEVSAPHDVVFDTSGQLLVADTGNARIAIYAVSGYGGRLVGSLSGRIRGPEGVAVHTDGRVFATGAWSNNLVVFADGKVVAERGGFSSPHDVEFSRDGKLWVADASADRMVQLNEHLETVAELKGTPYGFNGPRYMDFDDRNRMYVADKYNNQIKVVDEGGNLLLVLGTSQARKGKGGFDRPEGVEIHGSDIWFSDTYNNRIVRYRLVD